MRNADPAGLSCASHQRRSLIALWLLFAAAWLAARPYVGVRHDAIFYLAQALARLNPERFAGDLFFQHGSQDSFTIFTTFYAPVVDALGWPAAHAVMLAAGQALWLAALWALMSALFADRHAALLGCVGVALLPAGYGPLGLLTYGEPFVTARLFAEAAGLFALAMGVRRQWLLAFAATLLAGALHPVMAMPVLAALGLLLLWGRWLVLGALLLACMAGLAALALGLAPAIGPLHRMDPEWIAIIQMRSGFNFPTLWDWADWARFAAILLAGWIAALLSQGRSRALVATAVGVALAGMALAVLGGDVAGIHAVVAGQAWRWSWIAAVVANGVLFARLVRHLGEETGGARFRPLHVLALVSLGLAGSMLEVILPAWLAMLLAFLTRIQSARHGRALDLLMPVVVPVALGAALVLAATATYGLLHGDTVVAATIGFSVFLKIAVCALVLGTPARGAAQGQSGRLATSLFLLVLSCVALDRRSDWNRFLESANAESIEHFVASDGPVLWDGGLEILWFVTHSANYFSSTQAAGLAFHRQTALTFHARRMDFPFASMDRPPCDTSLPTAAAPSAASLRQACRRHPDLAIMILPHQVPGLASGAWTLPVRHPRQEGIGAEAQRRITFHRYDCIALRAGTAPASAP